MLRRSWCRGLGLVAVLAPILALAPTSTAAAAAADDGAFICYRAYIWGSGWQDWRCQGQTAGVPEDVLPIEALDIMAWGLGGICVRIRHEVLGWDDRQCGADGTKVTVGEPGGTRPIEAIDFDVQSFNAQICLKGQLVSYGWGGWACAYGAGIGAEESGFPLTAIRMNIDSAVFP